MGICQSRPEDDVDGTEARTRGRGPTSSASNKNHNKHAALRGVRSRRPSETSLCTIIPEATDHDDHAAWRSEADADSLTGRGMVYDKTAKKYGKASTAFGPRSAAGHPHHDDAVVVVAAAAAASPAMTEPTVFTALASPFSPMTPKAATAGASAASKITKSTSASSTSPSTPLLLALPSSALLHAYDDDDSTALPADDDDNDNDEEEDQAPTDEENDYTCDVHYERDIDEFDDEGDDERGPGRLVPAASPTKKKEEKKAVGVVSTASTDPPAVVASPTRSVGDAPGWRASQRRRRLVPRRNHQDNDDDDDDDADDDDEYAVVARSRSTSSPPASAKPRSTSSPPAASVHPTTLSEFQRIQIQAQLARKKEQKQLKAQKYSDRYRDVQGYKQLYREFQALNQKVRHKMTKGDDTDDKEEASASLSAAATATTTTMAAATSPDPKAALFSPMSPAASNSTPAAAAAATSTSPSGGAKSILRGRGVILAAAKTTTPPSTSATSASSSEIRKATSFDLHNSQNWYFDFQGADLVPGEMGPALAPTQQPQSNLSLLSESSLDVQRRLYAEKRRQRKAAHNHNKKARMWRGTPVRSDPAVAVAVAAVVPSTVTAKSSTSTPLGNLVSTVSSIVRRDYGPVGRQPRSASAAAAPTFASPSAEPQGEWVDQEINCVSNVGESGGGPEDPDYSYVSDMGDTASYTSNDYRVAAARRFPSSLYARPGSARNETNSAVITQDKLSELEAKIAALQERNEELAATRGVSSPVATTSAAAAAAACATTPVAASTAAATSGDDFRTPVATNRVASLRSIFEASSKPQPDDTGRSRSREAPGGGDNTREAVSMGLSDPAAALAMPTLEFETPAHPLESIEESLISAASSVSLPADACDSPTKSLLGDGGQGETPPKPSCVDASEGRVPYYHEGFQVDGPEESIDLPPADESMGLLVDEPSSVPLASTGSDIPALRGLDTDSTGASLDDDEEETKEVKEVVDARVADDGTPTKAFSSPRTAMGPADEANHDDDDDDDDDDDKDIFYALARDDSVEDGAQLEVVTPTKLQGGVVKDVTPHSMPRSPAVAIPLGHLVSKKVPMDPPGAALLDGTPSLETKRQPYRPSDSLLSPMAVRAGSTPTPQVSPIRRMPVDSSPDGSHSPQKNRWITELSTHQFLAMSEENALERLARLERNEAKKRTVYDPESESPTVILEDDELLEESTSPAGALFPDDGPVNVEGAESTAMAADPASQPKIEDATCDPSSPNELSSHSDNAATEPGRLDTGILDASDSPLEHSQEHRAKKSCADAASDAPALMNHDRPALQAGNEDPVRRVEPEVDSPVAPSGVEGSGVDRGAPAALSTSVESTAPEPAVVCPPSDDVGLTLNSSNHGAALKRFNDETFHGESNVAGVVDDTLPEDEPNQETDTSGPATFVLSDDSRHSAVASTEPEDVTLATLARDVEEGRTDELSSPQEESGTEVSSLEARSSINTAATSFVTAISRSAVLMEAWDDTAETDAVYASFGNEGISTELTSPSVESMSIRPDLSDVTPSIAAEANPEEGASPSVDAPPTQVSPAEAGVVIDKTFASIARVSPMILVADPSSHAYLKGSSMRTTSLEASAAPPASADFDDEAPDDELHIDESMSVFNKSHISHDVEETSCHSGSTRPSTNVKPAKNAKPKEAYWQPSPPSPVDSSPTGTEAAPSSFPTSASTAVPWSDSLELASAVEQQVQQVLERYRRDIVGAQVVDDDDAPEDELRAAITTTTS